jgi:transposase-like protein
MVGGIENEGESMPRTRKSRPPSLKAKVEVETIRAHKTAAQIAQMFGVCPTQVGVWKKQALAGLPDIFSNGREQMRRQSDLPAVALPGSVRYMSGPQTLRLCLCQMRERRRQHEHQAGEK